MNWLDFMASIVGSITSLAWPAAVVGSVWLFRKEIRLLLPHMKLKYADAELGFRLDEADKIAKELPVPALPVPEAINSAEATDFQRLVEASPSAAMLETRREMEGVLRKVAVKYGIENNSMHGIVRDLREKHAISVIDASLLDELRLIGNEVAHGPERPVSPIHAIKYKELADAAVGALRNLLG